MSVSFLRTTTSVCVALMLAQPIPTAVWAAGHGDQNCEQGKDCQKPDHGKKADRSDARKQQREQAGQQRQQKQEDQKAQADQKAQEQKAQAEQKRQQADQKAQEQKAQAEQKRQQADQKAQEQKAQAEQKRQQADQKQQEQKAQAEQKRQQADQKQQDQKAQVDQQRKQDDQKAQDRKAQADQQRQEKDQRAQDEDQRRLQGDSQPVARGAAAGSSLQSTDQQKAEQRQQDMKRRQNGQDDKTQDRTRQNADQDQQRQQDQNQRNADQDQQRQQDQNRQNADQDRQRQQDQNRKTLAQDLNLRNGQNSDRNGQNSDRNDRNNDRNGDTRNADNNRRPAFGNWQRDSNRRPDAVQNARDAFRQKNDKDVRTIRIDRNDSYRTDRNEYRENHRHDGMTDLQKFGLVALGAVAAGAVLSNGQRVVSNSGDRVVVQGDGGNYHVYHDDDALLRRPGVTYDTRDYNDGTVLSQVTQENGTIVYTVRDADGRVLRRWMRYPHKTQEVVLFDDTVPAPIQHIDVNTLPPQSPISVVYRDGTSASLLGRTIAEQPQQLDGRHFSMGQIRSIARVRYLAPEIDVATLAFPSGSSAIGQDDADALATLGHAMADAIRKDPTQVFLIEGHTDAVGDPASNLALSDARAEAAAQVLVQDYDVPPENLITQGYGESDLKEQTQGASEVNRRIIVRPVGALLPPPQQMANQ